MIYFGNAQESIDYLSIGHLTIDQHPHGDRPGGTVRYAACVAPKLGARIGVVTSAHPELDVDDWIGSGATCALKPAENTTTFRNVYEPSGRRQSLTSVAGRVGISDAPVHWRDARIIHLAPLVGEFDPEEVLLCPAGSLRCATIQGWLRTWDAGGGSVRPSTHPRLLTHIEYFDAIVVSTEDLNGLESAKRALFSTARLIAVTQGPAGADLWSNGRQFGHVRALPVQVVDPTGAGDVFATAFFLQLATGQDPLAAARYACCAASLSTTGKGVEAIADDNTIRCWLDR